MMTSRIGAAEKISSRQHPQVLSRKNAKGITGAQAQGAPATIRKKKQFCAPCADPESLPQSALYSMGVIHWHNGDDGKNECQLVVSAAKWKQLRKQCPDAAVALAEILNAGVAALLEGRAQ